MNANDAVIVDIARRHGYENVPADVLKEVSATIANSFIDDMLDKQSQDVIKEVQKAQAGIDTGKPKVDVSEPAISGKVKPPPGGVE